MVDRVKELIDRLAKTDTQRSYDRVFSTPDGKKVLADICNMGYVNSSTFAPLNPQKTLLNEGMRALALAILRRVKIQPQIIVEQKLESKDS